MLWAKVVWSRTIIARHAFVLWTFLNNRLSTKQRLNKFSMQLDTTCPRCSIAQESDLHTIYECTYAKDIWDELKKRWPLPITTNQGILRHLTHNKEGKIKMQVTYAIYAATVYNIWEARNLYIFQHKHTPAQQLGKLIKDQVIHRILVLNSFRNKFSLCLASLLK